MTSADLEMAIRSLRDTAADVALGPKGSTENLRVAALGALELGRVADALEGIGATLENIDNALRGRGS